MFAVRVFVQTNLHLRIMDKRASKLSTTNRPTVTIPLKTDQTSRRSERTFDPQEKVVGACAANPAAFLYSLCMTHANPLCNGVGPRAPKCGATVTDLSRQISPPHNLHARGPRSGCTACSAPHPFERGSQPGCTSTHQIPSEDPASALACLRIVD